MNFYDLNLKLSEATTTVGTSGLEKSWQQSFPKKTKCCKCKSNARIAFVTHEGFDDKNDKKLICQMHRNEFNKGPFWPHDAIAVAVYFCEKCSESTSLYNQA